jgi:hypothetical protein
VIAVTEGADLASKVQDADVVPFIFQETSAQEKPIREVRICYEIGQGWFKRCGSGYAFSGRCKRNAPEFIGAGGGSGRSATINFSGLPGDEGFSNRDAAQAATAAG